MHQHSSLHAAVTEPVVVQDYDSNWPALFEQECKAIQFVLPSAFEDIQHIGSTAVPGLRAKPIIDILAGVPDQLSTEVLIEPLSRLGYVPATSFSNTITDHPWFMRWAHGRRTHQLHIIVFGSIEWRRRIAFRDALRSDPALAAQYADLKTDLAQLHRHDRAAYTNGKTEFVSAITRDA